MSSDPSRPPRAVSGPKTVSITGYRLAFDRTAKQYVLLGMEGSDGVYLPVFSTDEKLLEFLGRVLETSAAIDTQIIGDEENFLASIRPEVRVVLDPHFTAEGKVRYTEILPQMPAGNA